MSASDLYDKLVEKYLSSVKFTGFSTESLHFFDDYPIDSSLSPEWWDHQKSTYEDYLKPEFHDLLRSLISVITCFDKGLEAEVAKCLGRTHDASTRPIPYRWAALHSANTDKRIDVQFFINLTSLGLRVGIFSGHHGFDTNAWNARQKRIYSKRVEIFQRYRELQDLGFEMLHTTKSDHASKSHGTRYTPENHDELYSSIAKLQQISFIKTLDAKNMNSDEICMEILKIFSDTRSVYQLLQSSKYDSYKRNLV